jgi:uncharacterized protein
MKIAIISDIHDNIINLEKCLEWCRDEKIEKIICCGDVTNAETVNFLSKNFQGEIYMIRGNMEIYKDEEIIDIKNIKYLDRFNIINLDGKNIGLCHEPFFIDQVSKLGDCEIIFYGHTHKPWINERGKMKIVNPGTLGGVFQKATFAYWETGEGTLELKVLEVL